MSSRITTFPLPDDKVDAWRQLASELMDTRRRDFDDLNRRYGLSQHRAWLERDPNGSHRVLWLHEGAQADRVLSDIASSSHPFDRWFAERFREVHGHDLAKPPPSDPATLALDWRIEPTVTRPLSSPPPPSPAAQRRSSEPPSPPRLRSTPPPLPARMRPSSVKS